MTSKIVVLGGINGQFRDVFKKVSALHAKNAFAFAIVAGNLFADPRTETPEQSADVDQLLEGKIDVSLPTYFTLSANAFPEKVKARLESSSGELCENLSFLGKRTTIKTSEGIRIVALGGHLDPNLAVGVSKDLYLPFYSEGDAKVLRGANSTDILITNEWPTGIKNGSSIAIDPGPEPASHQCIAELCSALRPRYHFSSSPDAFYEREPFLQPSLENTPDATYVTRFISLASYGNANKQKWIYAFSLDTATTTVSVPVGTTKSPFENQNKKRTQPTVHSYRFSNDREHRRGNKRRKAGPPSQSECFFCLSNPTIAQHLITSIGNETYVTTAKGPLSTGTTFEGLGFPSHMLIIPLTHAPTLALIEPATTREGTYKEMQQYRNALNSMLKSVAGGKLGSIVWEISRAGGFHNHWQFLPLPVDLIQRKLVEVAFQVQAENEKYPKIKKGDVGDGSREPTDFFRAIIWNPNRNGEEAQDESDTHLFLPVDSSFRFDLQFGRRVLAKLLGLEKRIQWQECGQSEEEEKADAEAFKKAFKAFDFSLDG